MVLAVEAAHRLNKRSYILAITYCCWRIIFCWLSSLEWYHFIHGTHFGSILTTEGWAVLDYVGSDPILHFGRGISVQGADSSVN